MNIIIIGIAILINAAAIVLVYRLLENIGTSSMSELETAIRTMVILMISIGFTVFILPYILQSYNPPTEPIVRDMNHGAKTVPHMGPGRIR